MKLTRSSGILLHPTSLPGRFGIGDFGPAAHEWIDTLSGTGTSLWQLLPLGPTGYGDSPYQCFSSFAGNQYLISPELLVEDGLLTAADLGRLPTFNEHSVDYGAVIPAKLDLLDTALGRLRRSGLANEMSAFHQQNVDWLDDYSLFMALKDAHDGRPWWTWSAPLRDRDPAALRRARRRNRSRIKRHIFRQFLFRRQWDAIRSHAAQRDVRLIGDLPIFVAEDSADVWANRDLFFLDDEGRPTSVAGVPPDYFAKTGQLWGNPLYRWEAHEQTAYQWWIKRMQATFDMVDIVRLDHFRGFAGYWEVPAADANAINGKWVDGPGAGFLNALRAALGELPIIAEDLGEITPDVIELRDRFELPGMKILQFAFDSGDDNDFLPDRYPEHCVVYTGTHDNDTTQGWFDAADESDKAYALAYLGVDGSDYSWDLIRAAWRSRAAWAIAPLQDVLSLGSEARMNFPGTTSGNWRWRVSEGAFDEALRERLQLLNESTGRTSAD